MPAQGLRQGAPKQGKGAAGAGRARRLGRECDRTAGGRVRGFSACPLRDGEGGGSADFGVREEIRTGSPCSSRGLRTAAQGQPSAAPGRRIPVAKGSGEFVRRATERQRAAGASSRGQARHASGCPGATETAAAAIGVESGDATFGVSYPDSESAIRLARPGDTSCATRSPRRHSHASVYAPTHPDLAQRAAWSGPVFRMGPDSGAAQMRRWDGRALRRGGVRRLSRRGGVLNCLTNRCGAAAGALVPGKKLGCCARGKCWPGLKAHKRWAANRPAPCWLGCGNELRAHCWQELHCA